MAEDVIVNRGGRTIRMSTEHSLLGGLPSNEKLIRASSEVLFSFFVAEFGVSYLGFYWELSENSY